MTNNNMTLLPMCVPDSSKSKRHRSDRDHHSSSSSRHPHSSSSSSHRPSSSSASRSSRPASGIVDVAKASKAFIPEAGSSSGAQKKPKSEFLCEIPFTNTLPEVPFEPKLLKIYLPLERLTRYCAGSLEASLKLPFLTDKMLGIPLDLLNPSQYNRPEYVTKGELDTADEAILPVVKDTLAAGERAQPTQLQLFQQGSSNWLRKQELQSNNLYDMAIRTTGSAEQIQKEYMRVEEAKKQLAIANTKEKQVALIETTFDQAQLAPVHPDPSKRHLRAVEIFDIFPDLSSSGEYAQAHNVEVNENALGPDGEPLLSEEELQQLRKKARFNIEYSWTEFDYPPIEETTKTTNGQQPQQSSQMQIDDVTSSPPVQSVSSGNLIPLIQSYSKKYHGFYLHDPNAPLVDDNKSDDDDEGSEKVSSKDPNLLTREVYKWQKEYVKVPTPIVNVDNNYFFIIKREEGNTKGTISYAQYNHRLKVAKRGQTKRDKSVQHEVRSRPAAIRVDYVKEYVDENPDDEDEEEDGDDNVDEEDAVDDDAGGDVDDDGDAGMKGEDGEDAAAAGGDADGDADMAGSGDEESHSKPKKSKKSKKEKKEKKERKREKKEKKEKERKAAQESD